MSLNLLAIPPKTTATPSAHLAAALHAHIAAHFTDAHPAAFDGDLARLQEARDEAVHLDGHEVGVRRVEEYYALLKALASKFPDEINLAFSWTLSFPSSTSFFSSAPSPPSSPSLSTPARSSLSHAPGGFTYVAHPTLAYERAALLFSLAALQSQLACVETRLDTESCKRAVGAFAAAAGILSHLLSLIPTLASTFAAAPRTADSDLSAATLRALRDVMLAQAQECAWAKAVVDRMKDGTIAKLAARVEALYASALEHAAAKGADAGACELPKEWQSHLGAKRWHFAAAAQFRKSVEDLGANRYGAELARLQLAQAHIKKALELAKARNVSPALAADAKSLQDVINSSLSRATRDNDLIYLDPIPAVAQLAPLVGVSMAEPRLAPDIKDPSALARQLGPLFEQLTPYSVHLAMSIYEDRKEAMLRELEETKSELEADASSTLQSLNLPGSLLALEQPLGLPASLLRKSDEVRLSGGLARLQSIAADVARVAASDARLLDEIEAHLAAEKEEDDGLRRDFKDKHVGNREPSDTAARELRRRAEEFAQTLQQAKGSDDVVRAKMDEWEDVIGVLDGGEAALTAFIPTGAPTTAPQSSAQTLCVSRLRRALEALDDVLDARAALLSEAQAQAKADDVKPHIVAAQAQQQAAHEGAADEAQGAQMFEPILSEGMEKYERFKEEMQRSAHEQEQQLEAIRTCNADFIEARKVDTTIKRREQALQMLELGHAKHREIASNLGEGLKFYNQLARLLSELRQDVKQWRRARQLDIDALVARFQGTTLSPRASSSGGGGGAAAGGATAAAAPSWNGVRTRAQLAAEAKAKGLKPGQLVREGL